MQMCILQKLPGGTRMTSQIRLCWTNDSPCQWKQKIIQGPYWPPIWKIRNKIISIPNVHRRKCIVLYKNKRLLGSKQMAKKTIVLWQVPNILQSYWEHTNEFNWLISHDGVFICLWWVWLYFHWYDWHLSLFYLLFITGSILVHILTKGTISSVKSWKILKVLVDSGSTKTLINRKNLWYCQSCKLSKPRKLSLADSLATSEVVKLRNLRLSQLDKNKKYQQNQSSSVWRKKLHTGPYPRGRLLVKGRNWLKIQHKDHRMVNNELGLLTCFFIWLNAIMGSLPFHLA